MKRALALIALGLALSGCGQKGGLYLPEAPQPSGYTVPAGGSNS